MRLVASDFALDKVTKTEPLESYTLDDMGFLKQGTESVCVQQQYIGSAGKIAVSLTVATASTHLTLDLGLYLPQSWTQDDERCQKAGVHEDIRFRPKHDIALDLLAASLVHGCPSLLVLAGAAYGNNSLLRREVTRLGLPYALGINATDSAHSHSA